ncbi:MAG TPA: STAS/SEC14 domain-containing protein, partial [Candidatus Methylacidiphilales bacterium]|nr:STAS/SEC14 domain-containing protein [Candidatus Methylacidiphilales bacterium]
IVPAVEKKLKTHPKIRFLYHLGEDFSGYSLEAMWDDAVLGTRHFTAFEKAAVVTDAEWVRNSVAFFRFLIPCPTRIFHNNELAAATEWINA